MLTFHPWPDIVSFHNLKKSTEKYPELLQGNSSVFYRSKIKLHGSNAAIQITHDDFITQSRTSIITPENDNFGFARWAESQKDLWMFFAEPLQKTVIFGEWCGPGINKGVAINKLDRPVFVIFAIHRFYYQLNIEIPYKDQFIVEPQLIKNIVRPERFKNVYILPWYSEEYNINFFDPAEKIQVILDKINNQVAEIEKCDPWVKEIFDKIGIGEGLVFYPDRPLYNDFKDLAFKAKGEEHRTTATKEPAQVDVISAESIDEFVKLVLTPARLEQGVRAVNNGELLFEMKNFGNFLKWINQDIIKENQAELEAAKLNFKQVSSGIANYARKWYQSQ